MESVSDQRLTHHQYLPLLGKTALKVPVIHGIILLPESTDLAQSRGTSQHGRTQKAPIFYGIVDFDTVGCRQLI